MKLRRLLPEEILRLTRCSPKEGGGGVEPPVVNSKASHASGRRHKNRESSRGTSPDKKKLVTSEIDGAVPLRRPRTIKETQQVLRVLHRKKATDFQDEAESTAAFFHNSPSSKLVQQLTSVFY